MRNKKEKVKHYRVVVEEPEPREVKHYKVVLEKSEDAE